MSECILTDSSRSLQMDQDESELNVSDLERAISAELLELRNLVNKIPPSLDRARALRMIEEINNIIFIH